MEIAIDAVTFGDLLAQFQQAGLELKLVPLPEEPGSYMLVARPEGE